MANNPFKKHKTIEIFEDGSCNIEQVKDITEDLIETDGSIFPRDIKYTKMYDNISGNIYYIYNLDLPAKIESEKIKKLRRSATLANIFDYNTGAKKFDLIGFMPW